MPANWRNALHTALISLRDFGLAALIVGAGQVLIALIVWPLVFRGHPLGLSMALSLVGFASWILAFLASMGDRRRRRLQPEEQPSITDVHEDVPVLERLQDQMRQSGCGFILLVSSILPLGIAFLMRLRADLRAGLTLRDIFPPMP